MGKGLVSGDLENLPAGTPLKKMSVISQQLLSANSFFGRDEILWVPFSANNH